MFIVHCKREVAIIESYAAKMLPVVSIPLYLTQVYLCGSSLEGCVVESNQTCAFYELI